jgi:formiminotetrahydrofolate cyclodeaminase
VSFADRTIDDFLDGVASASVTPSGGAVAAIGGAAGAALCEMVCVHTLRKGGYGDVEAELTGVREELGARRTRLSELADEDSAAVEELGAAFETPNEEGRDEAIQQAARRTVEVPLETAEECLGVVEHATAVTEKGTRNAVADAGTGAFLAHGALRASVSTVQFNLETIENATFVAEIERRSTEIDEAAETAFEQVKANVGDAH